MCWYCSKTDVMNLLESAGFSRSNPYYIVKQGKVSVASLLNLYQLDVNAMNTYTWEIFKQIPE